MREVDGRSSPGVTKLKFIGPTEEPCTARAFALHQSLVPLHDAMPLLAAGATVSARSANLAAFAALGLAHELPSAAPGTLSVRGLSSGEWSLFFWPLFDAPVEAGRFRAESTSVEVHFPHSPYVDLKVTGATGDLFVREGPTIPETGPALGCSQSHDVGVLVPSGGGRILSASGPWFLRVGLAHGAEVTVALAETDAGGSKVAVDLLSDAEVFGRVFTAAEGLELPRAGTVEVYALGSRQPVRSAQSVRPLEQHELLFACPAVPVSDGGYVHMKGLPEVPCVVRLRFEGFLPVQSGIVVPAPGGVEFAPLKLERAASIRGRVTDESTGLGIAGARVTLVGNPVGAVLTDEEGRYELSGIKPGTAELMITHAAYPEPQRVVLQNILPGVAQNAPVLTSLHPGRYVHVTALGPDGTSANGALLGAFWRGVNSVRHAAGRTDEGGELSLGPFAAGTVTLLDASGRPIEELRIEKDEDADAQVELQGVRIHGRLLSSSGEPIRGMVTHATQPGLSQFAKPSDLARDTYQLWGLAPGQNDVAVWIFDEEASSWHRTNRSVDVAESQGTVRIDLVVSRPPSMDGDEPTDKEQAPRLHGRVVDRLTGRPVAGLYIRGPGQIVQADEQGRFAMEMPVDGTHMLSAMASNDLMLAAGDLVDSDAVIVVVENGIVQSPETPIEIPVAVGPQRTLEVWRSLGEPAARVGCFLFGVEANKAHWYAFSDALGHARLRGPLEGESLVVFTDGESFLQFGPSLDLSVDERPQAFVSTSETGSILLEAPAKAKLLLAAASPDAPALALPLRQFQLRRLQKVTDLGDWRSVQLDGLTPGVYYASVGNEVQELSVVPGHVASATFELPSQ